MWTPLILAVTALSCVLAYPAEPEIKFSTTTSAPPDLDPDHVPSTVCETMLPSHGPNAPSTKEPPYTVTVSEREVAQGRSIKVQVKGRSNESFKGLYIQGRINDKPVGRWVKPSDNPQIKVSDCPPRKENALSYVTRREGLQTLTLEWIAPQDVTGGLVFQATIVKSYSEFWINVRSEPLKVTSVARTSK